MPHTTSRRDWTLTDTCDPPFHPGFVGEGVGEVFRFPLAGGYATYMVAQVDPPMVIHLPLGDA